jgi:hypothetical protein
MKLTKIKLNQLIKEELRSVLNEGSTWIPESLEELLQRLRAAERMAKGSARNEGGMGHVANQFLAIAATIGQSVQFVEQLVQKQQKPINEILDDFLPQPSGDPVSIACDNKDVILAALKQPKIAAYLVKTLGGERAEPIINAIEEISGMSVEEILSRPEAKSAVKMALMGCDFLR